MRVISRARLREFWSRPGNSAAQAPLEGWYVAVEAADWANFADLRRTFGTASQVGDCVVFNVGGNKWRLVARLRYRSHRVYVLRVMTHAEYDDQARWQEECGCHKDPPPPRPTTGRRGD